MILGAMANWSRPQPDYLLKQASCVAPIVRVPSLFPEALPWSV